MGINLPRLVISGLVAGFVINLGELAVNVWLLGAVWSRALTDIGLAMDMPAVIQWGIGSFVLGIVGVWIYAAIRSRYATGTSSALRAALALWACTYLYVGIGMMGTTGLPAWLLLTALVWGLVEMGVAVHVGAWMYRSGELVEGTD